MKEVLAAGTIKNYFTTVRYLKEFVSKQFKKKDIYFSELDYQFITSFEYFLSTITPQEFGTKSFSRNPLIFGLMQRINLVEKVGSGIKRMRDAMKDAGLIAPKFETGGFLQSFSIVQ